MNDPVAVALKLGAHIRWSSQRCRPALRLSWQAAPDRGFPEATPLAGIVRAVSSSRMTWSLMRVRSPWTTAHP